MLAEGKPADAATAIEPMTFDNGHTDFVSIWSIAKLQAGDLPSAAKGLAFLNSPAARGGLDPTAPFAYAMLARVQAQMEQKDEARNNYQKLFAIWKDADPDLPLLVQARQEFDKLGS